MIKAYLKAGYPAMCILTGEINLKIVIPVLGSFEKNRLYSAQGSVVLKDGQKRVAKILAPYHDLAKGLTLASIYMMRSVRKTIRLRLHLVTFI